MENSRKSGSFKHKRNSQHRRSSKHTKGKYAQNNRTPEPSSVRLEDLFNTFRSFLYVPILFLCVIFSPFLIGVVGMGFTLSIVRIIAITKDKVEYFIQQVREWHKNLKRKVENFVYIVFIPLRIFIWFLSIFVRCGYLREQMRNIGRKRIKASPPKPIINEVYEFVDNIFGNLYVNATTSRKLKELVVESYSSLSAHVVACTLRDYICYNRQLGLIRLWFQEVREIPVTVFDNTRGTRSHFVLKVSDSGALSVICY